MKVGILTHHDGINHGSFLQAYCLQETLKSFGLDVCVINYKSRYQYEKEYTALLGTRKSYLNPRTYLNLTKFKMVNKIFKFRRNQKLFNLTKFSHDASKIANSEDFDLVLLGSDEIWNFKNPIIGIDLAYFGKEIKAKRIVSYAPSFGQINPDDALPEEIIRCLKRLSAISVRDNNSLEILNKLSLPAEKVLDPTFLCDIHLPNSLPRISNYILIYMTSVTNEEIQKIRHYAQENGKKLVAVGYEQNWCDRSFMSVDIFEWLIFFKHADMVITNGFHGTVYSILNKKKFCVLNPGVKSNKVENLLKDFDLACRKIDKPDLLEDILKQEIDYERVFQMIEAYRKKSVEYLEKVCKRISVNDCF